MSNFVSPKSIEAAKTTDRKLIFIPVMLVLFRIWGTVRYALFIYRSEDQNGLIQREISKTDKVLLCLQVNIQKTVISFKIFIHIIMKIM